MSGAYLPEFAAGYLPAAFFGEKVN